MNEIGRRDVIKLAGVAAGTALVGSSAAHAADASDDKLESIRKSIEGSRLPGELKKRLMEARRSSKGTVYYIWANGDGTVGFGVLKGTSGDAYYIKAGTLAGDVLMNVLQYAYEKQIIVSVFADTADPGLASSILTWV